MELETRHRGKEILRNFDLQNLYSHRDDEMYIGGVSVSSIVAQFGSPLYVYDATLLRQQLQSVQDTMGSKVQLLFALKSNPNAAVANVLCKAGSGADVASAGEIHVALAAGYDASQIQFAGPGKNEDEITLSIQKKIQTINIESAAEYEEIARIAHQLGRRQGIAIRVNPQKFFSGSRMKMGGGSKKFGVDAEEVEFLIRRILEDDFTMLRGLHIYVGTQCFDADAWVGSAKWLVNFANDLEVKIGVTLQSLNFGGGFGVPCFEGDPDFDLDRAGKGIRELIAADGRSDRKYFIELGRYLVANAGVYLTRVVYLKKSRGKKIAILDGGMHHHSAAAGVGGVIRRSFPVVACQRLLQPSCGMFTLAGPLCTPTDEFVTDAALPEIKVGDLLAVLVSGAYGFTFSNVLFLSHPTPGEVLVDNRKAVLVRTRGKVKDSLHGQIVPNCF